MPVDALLIYLSLMGAAGALLLGVDAFVTEIGRRKRWGRKKVDDLIFLLWINGVMFAFLLT